MKISKMAGVIGLASGVLLAADNKPPSLTFLDTLNKGRELAITGADYPPPPGQATATVVVPPPPGVNSADTAAGKKEIKREAGVVPSRFRIQILASSHEYQVKQEKNRLAAKTKLPLIISFESPYYKLLAGDFVQRSEAENYLAQIKQLGYNDAWIVRTAEVQR